MDDKTEILLELVSRVLTGEYELCEVRRSNHYELQEYDFVIKKAAQVVGDGQMCAIPREAKASEVGLNRSVLNRSVKINVENINELEKLLRAAAKQTEQLQQTLGEIQRFQLKIISQVDEKHTH